MMNMRAIKQLSASLFTLGLICVFFLHTVRSYAEENYIHFQKTNFLSFQELIALSKNPSDETIAEKLETFWITPIIDNAAYYQGIKPHRPIDARLGPFMRLASWNIEQSLRVKEAIMLLSVSNTFFPHLLTKKTPHSIQALIRQRDKLVSSDVIVLQEMEIGVKRSGYINAAEELAHALNMNYAFAPEYLEVDPVNLGVENIYFEDGSVDNEATSYYSVDPARYKGVFGSAVLSHYPIKHVEIIPLKHQGYDWYHGEVAKTTFIEKTRRLGAKIAFKNEITREIKIGGRIFFRVDLDVPDIPEGTVTIINIHLEIKCLPKERQEQMREILDYIKDIKNPVIVAGDFNSAPGDLSPTSISRVMRRNIKNPTNWASAAVSYISPYGLLINTSRSLSNVTKNLQDPLAWNVPVIAPNKVRSMFSMIEDFRFQDGGAFDFRGDSARSVNGEVGKLADANQKDLKGFKTTFSVKRSIAEVIGKYRLDWIFVKSYLTDPLDYSGPYRFAPHFGETLEELNTSLKQPISDHHSNVVDLPFKEPYLK